MHVPDGFFDAPTSVACGIASVGVVAVSLKQAAADLTDKLAPMAGLASAFIFALQMLNFPVASGTSGHLLGGVLAAVLVGPWAGTLCIAVVLAVQTLLFADGGLTAYGINVLLLGIVPCFLGYAVFQGVRKALPATQASTSAAAFVAALVSVPAAAAVFSVLFAGGGSVELPFGSVLTAMVGTHVLIGIGEAVITTLVLSAVLSTRPDLVRGAADLAPARLLEGRPA